jgi:hypothetical protein
MKCSFCDLEAISSHRLYLGESPKTKEGFIHWEFYGEPIYTCGKHSLSHVEFDMSGEVINRTISE